MRIEQTLAKLSDRLVLAQGAKEILTEIFHIQVIRIKETNQFLLPDTRDEKPIERQFRRIDFVNNESLLVIIDLQNSELLIDGILFPDTKDLKKIWIAIVKEINNLQKATEMLSQFNDANYI